MDGALHIRDRQDTDDRGMELYVVQMVFVIIAGLFVLARAYVKIFIVKNIAVDDWLIFGAMIGYAGYGAVAIHGVAHGATGKHAANLTVEEAAISLRGWYICEVMYSPITLAIRTSIALLLLRLAVNKYHRWIIYANMVIIWMISIAFFFIMTFQCMPPSYFWRQLYGDKGSCINFNIVPDATIAHSVISAISDWCMGLLPIALLWNVQLNRRTKALVAVLLSMGMIAGVALIVRIPYVKHLAISTDFLYETIDVAIWSVMEPALGIIAASVTSLRPLFQNWGFGWNSKGKDSRPSGRGWSKTSDRREPAIPNARGGKPESSNYTERTSYDIDQTLPDTGSDIELRKTVENDMGEESRAEDDEHNGSQSCFDFEQRDYPQEPQTSNNRPVIKVRTTIDVLSQSNDCSIPPTDCSAGEEAGKSGRRGVLGRMAPRS
ncbi:putative integral membrane protein [Colletotrichum sublineola]|uniref:Putative integral membrane protein n=1 Tax=Colletotrichum sublineola TaxID=1173701 RepID=A0A066WZD8_COLSU|nr:putative integral membrane protein [Colletotrichum sublineola]